MALYANASRDNPRLPAHLVTADERRLWLPGADGDRRCEGPDPDFADSTASGWQSFLRPVSLVRTSGRRLVVPADTGTGAVMETVQFS